jgi:hypothetical protein
MAFAFFRRRQKMVIIVMVVLMAAFLVGSQGFRMLLESIPAKEVVGTTTEGDLKRAQVWTAQADLDVLSRVFPTVVTYGRDGRERPQIDPRRPTALAFLLLTRQEADAALAYALLLMEADKLGVRVRDEDVDDFFLRDLGYGQEGYGQLVEGLRVSAKLPESRLREAAGRWVRIHRAYARAAVDAVPSETELAALARDLHEQINLRVLQVPAEDFLDEVAEPNRRDVVRHFGRYRAEIPGAAEAVSSFGFGYRMPNRVAVLYMLIREDVIAPLVQPAEEDIQRYYQKHKRQFVRGGRQQPISAVWSDIADILRADAAERTVDRFAQQLSAAVDAYATQAAAETALNPYEWAVRQVTVPAEQTRAVLARTVRPALRDVPIDRAVDALAAQADLTTIRYPYGADANATLDPNVRVTLAGEMTLGQALDRIAAQARWPAPQWAMCTEFPGVLFARGRRGFPVFVEQTDLLTLKQLRDDEILGAAQDPATGEPLALRALRVAPFVQPNQRDDPRILKLHQNGPPMEVFSFDGPRGRLLWRVVEASGKHTPAALTDEIEARVVRDLKIQAAFAKAYQAAQQFDTAAFEQAVEDGNYAVSETGLFARKIDVPGVAGVFRYPDLPLLQLPLDPSLPPEVRRRRQDALLKAFIDRVFSPAFGLLPEEPDPPYPPKSAAVAVLRVPALRRVLLLRRIGYQPLVESDYREGIRTELIHRLIVLRDQLGAGRWFSASAVQHRLQFQGAAAAR